MNRVHFDAIVVGSGTSAYYAADELNNKGRKVAIVDELPYGGTCALRGCQPKKYLVSNAEAIAMVKHLVGKGIVAPAATDWEALQALKNDFLDGRSDADVRSWEKRGVVVYHGRAVMTDNDEITVNQSRLAADNIILATGALPQRAAIPGSEFIRTSDDFLDLPELPGRILFIGGGYISFEFAHVAKRAGAAEVTILHRSDRPLKFFDRDVVSVVLEAGEAEGIHVVLNESPVGVERQSSGYVLKGTTGSTYQADLIIEATGREPNLSVLESGQGNVQYSPRGIVVNEYLQSVSNQRVYAVGDCADSGYMLAPVADEEGKTAALNILHGNVRQIDYSVVPSAVFTIPSIGSVGMTEEQALEQGLDFRVNRGSTLKWPSSKRIGERFGAYKVLIENPTDRIIGAHLARHNGAETINVLALAMKYGICAKDLAEFMWAYPTMVSDLKYMVR